MCGVLLAGRVCVWGVASREGMVWGTTSREGMCVGYW